MSLLISSLNSGSNGNCYYVGSATDAVLIDAGISCRETERRMKRSGLSMEKVRAIFISHEHSDHIRGVEVLSKKYQLPVYISKPTFRHSRLRIETKRVKDIRPDVPVKLGELSVVPFSKLHDAADPFSFVIEREGICVGVLTDIGSACERVIRYFSRCHAAFLEANYDEEMLEKGRYPFYLKKRIRSDKGHLSNRQALELFLGHAPAHMSHLLLAHLSKENNKPELVQELFQANAKRTFVTVASRYRESEVYLVNGKAFTAKRKSAKGARRNTQLALF